MGGGDALLAVGAHRGVGATCRSGTQNSNAPRLSLLRLCVVKHRPVCFKQPSMLHRFTVTALKCSHTWSNLPQPPAETLLAQQESCVL